MSRLVIAAALLGLVAGVGLAACASQAPARVPGYEAMDSRKEEIRDLWMQIRSWRVDLRMSPDPSEDLLGQAASTARSCPAEAPTAGTCGDTCNLKDAICDNAESICRIADELDGDSWATDKCTSARASCKEAADRCCTCARSSTPAIPGE
jgi:hypothetical protein